MPVPADIMVDELHGVIQVAFEWDDYHPYAFATDCGVFGPPDSALPVRSDKSVTLEQVAPGENATIRYLYDFDDCWEHDIVVEKVVMPALGVVYPRCASGRGAAPPEDRAGCRVTSIYSRSSTTPITRSMRARPRPIRARFRRGVRSDVVPPRHGELGARAVR